MNTQKNMPRIGETATVYTHLNVREDALDLYGFSTKSELNCYKMLTTISGVGPKAALSILSEMTPEGVAMAAASGDSKKFTKASGVGPKLAQRIVLELKDRVKKMGFTGGTLELTGTDDAGIVSASQNAEQAVQALIVLGYTQSEAAPGRGEAGRLPLYGRTYSRRFKEYGKPLLIHAERRVLFA